MKKKTRFQKFKDMIDNYFIIRGIELEYISTLHDASENDAGESHVYNGSNDIPVIDMDAIAKDGYKLLINPNQNPINTADAFVINDKNEWYFIEFKDTKIDATKSSLKDNLIKKAYSNWYMILDIIYKMKDTEFCFKDFDFSDPVKFVKEHVYYIVVCSASENPSLYLQIKNQELINDKYTPPFMYRIKDYLFKDAYIYTEHFLERKFVKGFEF